MLVVVHTKLLRSGWNMAILINQPNPPPTVLQCNILALQIGFVL